VSIDVRSQQSDQVQELFLTGVPSAGDAGAQAKALFHETAAALRQADARIVQERILFSPGCEEAVCQARQAAYGDLDDTVPPALLLVEPTAEGPIAGLQIHAVSGKAEISPLVADGRPKGRLVRGDASTLVTASGITATKAKAAGEQARAMLETAEQMVREAGADMFCVARTWMWLTDLLDWYDEFNAVRNDFFRERGLLGQGEPCLPASTGISISSVEGGHCAMDMVAVLDPAAILARHQAGGDQGSAFDYGSAFSRALEARTLAGTTVYVSGTAAIDPSGATEFLDDPVRQLDRTIAHARAILDEGSCTDDDVGHAIMYCKTPEVEAIFREQFADTVPWPTVIAVCDICRDDLLCEAELAAIRPA